ncbi:MAG TPA: hypothetical protein VEA38_15680 [Terriglobales bacterium]|nr:hypothetical protein [Terriglobales bacterium]
MGRIVTAMALLLVLGPGTALGQTDRGVLDILPDVLGLKRTVRGHVVQHREATLVLRGDDRRTYTINTAGLEREAMTRLKEGQPVVVGVKPGGESPMAIATSVEPGAGAPKVFRRVEGTIESVSEDRVVFKARDGMTLVIERARIIGEAPRVMPQELATVVYEQEPGLAGVWIDSRDSQPSATPR